MLLSIPEKDIPLFVRILALARRNLDNVIAENSLPTAEGDPIHRMNTNVHLRGLQTRIDMYSRKVQEKLSKEQRAILNKEYAENQKQNQNQNQNQKTSNESQ